MSRSRLGGAFKSCIKNLVRHPLVAVASLMTVTLTLLVLAVFIAVSMNVSRIAARVEKSPPVQIFTTIDVTDGQLMTLTKALTDDEDVSSFTHNTPEQNAEVYKRSLGSDNAALSNVDIHIMPHSYSVTLKDPSVVQSFQMRYLRHLGVRKVEADTELIQRLIQLRRILNVGVSVAFVILCLISFFIISNMIRISIHARGEEIEIMKYVGATNSYIRRPHVLEGILIGWVGAILASVIIFFAYRGIYIHSMHGMTDADTLSFSPPSTVILAIFIVTSVLGILVGSIASAISVRKHIRV